MNGGGGIMRGGGSAVNSAVNAVNNDKREEDALFGEILASIAEMGRRWGFEIPIGRIWAFMLFQPRAVTQREIEQGTGYSRGLISRSLRKMEAFGMIHVFKEGKEMKYAVNLSLTEGFNDFLKRLLCEKIRPMIDLLVRNIDKVDDEKLRKVFTTLISEYQRLHLLISVFSKIIDDVNAGRMSEKELEKFVSGKRDERLGFNVRMKDDK